MNARINPAFEAIDAYGSSISQVFPPLEDVVDELDNHRNAPRPDPACLYGLIGDIAKAGSATTEANPYAVAASAIAYLGCAAGRGPYMPVGNTWHHTRFFMLHIGRSGEGRKGDAVSLIKRIARRVAELSVHHAPQVHTGGLSSREGLAFLIHDGYKEGKEEIPPVNDKRLLVIESEFVNILAQGKRDGNTLSAALRDCWDGVSIRPATKTNRLWASDPHVNMLGAVTGSELVASINSRDLSNGFANRFLPYWAERSKLLPFPKATTQEEVDRLANRVLEVLKFCEADRWVEHDVLRVELSPEAVTRWAELYTGELNDRSHGERINALIERRAHMLLRLAMLFALTDCTSTVEVRHLNAALAWIRYSVETVKFVFGSAADEAAVAEVNDTAEKIVAFITSKKRVTRTEITRDCFKGNVHKTQIDDALSELLTANPARIFVQEERPERGKPTKFYTLNATNNTKFKKNQQPRGFAGSLHSNEPNEVDELPIADSSLVSDVRKSTNQPQTRMNPSDSLNSSVRSRKSESGEGYEKI